MSEPIVADMRILNECTNCCRYKGSYMSDVVADIEDLT